ncbi:MAG: hypothetical protein AB2609_18650 [Candidatus Thiodiazotropha sp.]
MKTRTVAIMLTLAAGPAIAGEGGDSLREAYDVCDEQLHDAYGRPVPDDRPTVISDEASQPVGDAVQSAPMMRKEEVADAKG